VAYLSDEQGGSAESGPLALKEWGRRDALNGDRAAGGRDGRSGAAIQHRREVPGRGGRALALPGEGAAAPLALDPALRLQPGQGAAHGGPRDPIIAHEARLARQSLAGGETT